jgi:glycerol-3-phosphate acyltransferase PlsY
MSLYYTLGYFLFLGLFFSLFGFKPALVWYAISFTIGGIPFGYLIAKYVAGIDITQVGSGNIGATNVLRALKEIDPQKAKKLAILTLVLDALKGALPILIAKMMGVCPAVLWGMAVLAVLGHCFSPFMKFEGGKGVATTLGALIVLVPWAVILGVVVWAVVAKTLKISSVASLAGLIAGVIGVYLFYPNLPIDSHAPIWIILVVVIYKHRQNIYRLLTGREKRV